MPIQYIDSKLPFKFCRPRAGERAPEGRIILIGVTLTFWVPTTLFSLVIGNPLPLSFTCCAHFLGLPIGLLLYRFEGNRELIEIPLRRTPAAVNCEDRSKKAA